VGPPRIWNTFDIKRFFGLIPAPAPRCGRNLSTIRSLSIILLGEALTGSTTLALALIMVGLLVVGPKSEAADIEVQFVPRSRRKAQKSFIPWS
jgi:hypothetical protein